MTPTPWSPLQERFNSLFFGGLVIMACLCASTIFGYDEQNSNTAVFTSAAHTLLTLFFTVLFFRVSRERFRRSWKTTPRFPPNTDEGSVIEGRITSIHDPLLSPYSNVSCVAWGIVEAREDRLNTIWVTRPFFLDDASGRGRILIEPMQSSEYGFHLGVPDLVGSTYLGGESCPPEIRYKVTFELEKSATAKPDGVQVESDRVRGNLELARLREQTAPLYEIVIQEGDVVMLRGVFLHSDPPYIPETPSCSYRLKYGQIERGSYQEITTRKGYHWYGILETNLILASLASTTVIGVLSLL